MKQERKLGGVDRGLDTHEPAGGDVGASTPEPLRSFDGGRSHETSDESLRGKSDGEILQRYEF